MLAVLGGALGLLFARWGVSLILSMLPLPAIPEALVFQLDARVLVFTAAVSLACTLLFGLAPAWRAMRVDLSHGPRCETRHRAQEGRPVGISDLAPGT